MEFKVSRLNNTILAFSIICVAITTAAAYYFARITMADELTQKVCNNLYVLTSTTYGAQIKKHDYSFMDKFVLEVLVELGRPVGLCYVRVLDARSTKQPPYEYDNTVLVSIRNDQQGLKNFLEVKLDPLPTLMDADHTYTLPATKREIREVVWPLGNGGVLRMGFLSETFYSFDAELRQNYIIIGLFMMFLTSLGVLVLNSAVNRRIDQISYEQSEKTRLKTRADMATEMKKVQAAELRKPDDNPLDCDELFGILDFAKKASANMDMEEVLRLAVLTIVRIVGVTEVTIYLADEAGENLVTTVGHDSTGFLDIGKIKDERIPVGQGDVGSAAEQGTTMVIDMPTPGYAIVTAILSRNQVMGVFRCVGKVNGKPFGKREKLICRQISEILGHNLYNVIMYINKM